MPLFDGFLSFLTKVTDDETAEDFDAVLVSATSLLIHVMDADGLRLPEEEKELRQILSKHYGVQGSKLDKLFAAGEQHEQNSIDFYAATRVLQNALERGARCDFVAMMWRIVYADGERHEVEDHVLNRIADLIGVERAEQIALRQEVQAELKLN